MAITTYIGKREKGKLERKTVSGIVLTLLLVGMLTLTLNIQPAHAPQAFGDITIGADGSVDPPTAPIQRDGNMYTFTDNILMDEFCGIIVNRSNIIIDGNGYTLSARVSGRGDGFSLYGINNVTIQNTNIEEFFSGVHLDSSSSNTVSANHITSIYFFGIELLESSGNTISGNEIATNVPGASGFWIGISLLDSSNNSIYGNDITNNDDGIWLTESSNNRIYGNHITNNKYDGIWLISSSNNSIYSNHIATNSMEGGDGISLSSSSNNSLCGNNITNNNYEIRLYDSSNNTIYHNNFIDNMVQANVTSGYVNTWDNGCEGNYWSNYAGTDSDGDGIGDTPHIIDANNEDDYPLMNPYIDGDINHDGTVNTNDLLLVDNAYGNTPEDFYWNCHCDITGPQESPDELIDIYDLATVGRNYGKSYPD